jgi:hypothetical protein
MGEGGGKEVEVEEEEREAEEKGDWGRQRLPPYEGGTN